MSSNFFSKENPRVFSVREVNFAAKNLLENGLPLLWVRGEISNFVGATSGHWYFSLKDEQAQIRCVMFRQKNQYMDWQPKNGMQVEVLALATLYEARGEFQLTLEQMRPAGAGALYEAFERLKRKLEVEGLFEAARKRTLPVLPKQIGIVTSRNAAALRDVLTTLARRMPSVPVVLYAAPVQGEGAAPKIAQAIREANERAECDVLLLCRGGGSIEDLWAFNDEAVARAIAGSAIPVVSGIGHETDFTIADFAADHRAATPTAAAQLVVPERTELLQRLHQQALRLARARQRQAEQVMQRIDFLQHRLVHPLQRMRQQAQTLAQLGQRLHTLLTHNMQHQQWRWRSLRQSLRAVRPDMAELDLRHVEQGRRLFEAMQRALQRNTQQLDGLQQHLLHLNPDQVLARGYSVVREQGRVVTDDATLSLGAIVEITFARGWARAQVKNKSGTDESE
jgi:exodeoxyribonuclease VII large subunit